jgi:serine protease Do
MAAKTAILICGILVLAASSGGGAETDPVRRSLVVEAVERASPAVVNISTEEVVEQRGSPFPFPQDPFFDEFFRDFRDPRPRRYTRESLGSGVIVADDGTILTNLHVILRGSRIHVTLADEREFDATLVGADADSDLAVLRVKAGGALPYIALGSSRDLMIGETVIAIGNPFGLAHTVTSGVVSAIGRSLHDEERTFTDLIQTDASINPGNSGGPLLNIRGQLVGINTAIYGKAQGIGFAIPVDRVSRVMREIVSYGEVRRVWTGLVVQDLTPDLERHFGVTRGVVVATVEGDSPAAKAGLERGDVLTQVDGREVRSEEEFERRVQDHAQGERVSVTRRRDGADAVVTLTAAPFPAERADELAWSRLGLEVAEGKDGVDVRRVRGGSPAARIGVERGDRVLALDGTEVHSVADFRRRMFESRRARGVLLSIARGRYQYNVRVPLADS